MELPGRLGKAAERIMREHMNPVFETAGLQPGEFDVLATLRRAGTPYTLTPHPALRRVMISSGGLTARWDRLEQAGLLQRRPDPADRRGRLIALTRKGRDTVDRTMDLHVANEPRLPSILSTSGQRQLNTLLKKLLGGL